VTTPWEMRVWNGGDALYTDIDWNAIPIRPSAGNWSVSKLSEYWVAAPRVCDLA
jgi:hypothetical protein